MKSKVEFKCQVCGEVIEIEKGQKEILCPYCYNKYEKTKEGDKNGKGKRVRKH